MKISQKYTLYDTFKIAGLLLFNQLRARIISELKTLDNLKAAASGENEEWSKLYPEFADVAEKEGFPEVAGAFRMISSV